MTVYRNDGRWDRSNVEYEAGRIIYYDKAHPTSRMRYIDYGLGAFHRAAFDEVAEDEPSDLADLYRSLVARDGLAACEVSTRFYEVGSREGIAALESHLRTRGGQ
jgi:hypothetical protein